MKRFLTSRFGGVAWYSKRLPSTRRTSQARPNLERLEGRLIPSCGCTPGVEILGNVAVITHCGPNGAWITVEPLVTS